MKIQKKLALSSQTLRTLSADSLRGVGGGMSADPVRCRQSAPLRCQAGNAQIVFVPPFTRLHEM